jgi:hypothetical protein
VALEFTLSEHDGEVKLRRPTPEQLTTDQEVVDLKGVSQEQIRVVFFLRGPVAFIRFRVCGSEMVDASSSQGADSRSASLRPALGQPDALAVASGRELPEIRVNEGEGAGRVEQAARSEG